MARAFLWLALFSLIAVPARAEETPPSKGPSAMDIGGYVSIAMGGALLAGGAALAIFALHKRIELEAVCQPRDQCPIAAAPDIDQMQLSAHIATGLSVPGFLSVGIGAALLLWPEGPAAQIAIAF